MNTGSVKIIAEAGVNHNGRRDLALQLVDAAAEAGADMVKFQTFRADKLASKLAVKADYQARTTNAAESQLDMLRRLELSQDDHDAIVQHCAKRGIGFLSTPFDSDSLALLIDRFAVEDIKIGSGDLTNAPLLLAAARTGRRIILSTGMSTLGEVEAALGVLAYGYARNDAPQSRMDFDAAYFAADGRDRLRHKVTLLHCTTEYPAPVAESNLKAMETLRGAFGLNVGFSDHTQGIAIAIAATARGASVIEKHFTLDRTMDGPDHPASLEPADLKEMVQAIRQVEAALGDGAKLPSPSETKNKSVARKCLVAAQPIKSGDIFTYDNLTVKRAGNGISPFEYWDRLGRPADHDYAQDEPIR